MLCHGQVILGLPVVLKPKKEKKNDLLYTTHVKWLNVTKSVQLWINKSVEYYLPMGLHVNSLCLFVIDKYKFWYRKRKIDAKVFNLKINQFKL